MSGAGDQRKAGRAAPEAVVDGEREREGDPGEEEVPDERAVSEVAAVEKPDADHRVDEEREPEQRCKCAEAPVAHSSQGSGGSGKSRDTDQP